MLTADISAVVDAVQILADVFTGWVTYVLVLACYVLLSAGLYALAARRKVPRPWLALLPVGNLWLLGSLADSYRLQRGQSKHRRKVLLILSIVAFVLLLVLTVTVIWVAVKVITNAPSVKISNEDLLKLAEMTSEEQAVYYLRLMIQSVAAEPALVQYLYSGATAVGAIAAVLLCIHTAAFVVSRIALRDVFVSCDPDKAVWMTVVSILLPPAMPLLLFLVRKRDMGLVQAQKSK